TDYGFSDPIPQTSGDESLPVGCGWGVVFNGYGLAALGQADGVMQYWFNGTPVLDRHDILYRTGARPTIQFHQFLITPYIGDGSPVDQYMWIDDLTVATGRPSVAVASVPVSPPSASVPVGGTSQLTSALKD